MILLATALHLVFVAGCATHVTARPELSEGAGYRSVSILPPMVSIDKSKMTGGESLVAEALMMEDKILALLSERLVEKGYEANTKLTLEKLDQDPELKRAVTDLQTRLNELLPVMSRDLKGVAEGRFSLGGEVPIVGSASGADLLVFVQAHGLVVSGGLKAFEAIMSLGQSVPEDYLAMMITLVDARDGRVMATVTGFAHGSYLKAPDRLVGKALTSAFKKFPAAPSAPRSGPPANASGGS